MTTITDQLAKVRDSLDCWILYETALREACFDPHSKTMADLIERTKLAQAALTTIEQSTGWQDISSAPKDGTEFLAYQNGDFYKCSWVCRPPEDREDCGTIGFYDHSTETIEHPTHWQLITPPNSGNKGGI